MEQHPSVDKPETYQIKVQGRLDEGWLDSFGGMTVTLEGGHTPITTLSGAVADQAALRGMLCKLWDLNLTLISVRRIEADSKKEEDND